MSECAWRMLFFLNFILVRSDLPLESQIDLSIKSRNSNAMFYKNRRYLTIDNPHKDCHYNDIINGNKKAQRPLDVNITKFSNNGNIIEGGHTHYNFENNINDELRVKSPPDACVGFYGYNGEDINMHDMASDDGQHRNLFNTKINLEDPDSEKDIIKRDLRKVFNDEFDSNDMHGLSGDVESDESNMNNNYKHTFAWKDPYGLRAQIMTDMNDFSYNLGGQKREKNQGLKNRNFRMTKFDIDGRDDDMKSPYYRMRSQGFNWSEDNVTRPDEYHESSTSSSHSDDTNSYDEVDSQYNEHGDVNKEYLLDEDLIHRKSNAEQFVKRCDADTNCLNRLRAVHDDKFYDIHAYPEDAGNKTSGVRPFRSRSFM